MPKIDISSLKPSTGSSYPAPYDAMVAGRSTVRLGAAAGLTQFGANIVRLAPGALSSLRHWHEQQDEFLMVTEGVLTLVDGHGETEMHPGDCAAFPANDQNGHHMVNRSSADGAFLVIGTRTATETAWYSDVDMKVEVQDGDMYFTRRDGTVIDHHETSFSRISGSLTKALMTDSFALYQSLFTLPLHVVAREGHDYKLTDLQELEDDFNSYRTAMTHAKVTNIRREVLARGTGAVAGSKRVSTQVQILSGDELVMQPFTVNFDLIETPQGWRINRIESAQQHIEWTLGRVESGA
ncbi:cupin domain-containing protein [Primorskyibacter sp. 2E107]|uniref:cupin domain-containing protein n=1 Tax=Primorskyibacter sp. 2E107 TaxID=3403458 RepID=UPI003AF57275